MDIITLRKEQHNKFLQIKEIEIAKQKIIDEKIHNDNYTIKCVLEYLDNIIKDISKCKDLIKFDMILSSFKTKIIENSNIFKEYNRLNDLQTKIYKLIESISNNNNITFNVINMSKYERSIISKTMDNLKNICRSSNLDELIIEYQFMDTSNDEEIARKLSQN
jgi:hypothetical protein